MSWSRLVEDSRTLSFRCDFCWMFMRAKAARWHILRHFGLISTLLSVTLHAKWHHACKTLLPDAKSKLVDTLRMFNDTLESAASIFGIGYQGKLELGVVSLGSIACQYQGIFCIPRPGHQPGYAVYTNIRIWSEETCRSANTEHGLLSLLYNRNIF